MNDTVKLERRKNKNREMRDLVSSAKETCNSFFGEEFIYDEVEAMEELGLDDELIHQLVEDYVIQILKAISVFEEYIFELQSSKDAKSKLDYTLLRELAHKNLGVARNLRIKDAEILLHDLMKKDDLEHLYICLETLRSCAIVLKPECAFDTIKLIEIKSTF
ncbi:MAG: hypothetical protein U9O86_06110 [Campylobacterota bacterium]|nr:hypothetical protein [Campylobacterota bacterium]